MQSLINFGEEDETTPLRDMHFIEAALWKKSASMNETKFFGSKSSPRNIRK
jgi:hypothetical protein